MNRRDFACALLSAPAFATAGRDQSIARLIEREMTSFSAEFLLLSSGPPIEQWTRANVPAPLGSLAKPFLALAYGEDHDWRFPELDCTGCWLARGHGRTGITRALAHSCNFYFTRLAEETPFDQVERIAQRYGLPPPPDPSPDSLIGRHGHWRAQPLRIAAAYHELAHRRSEPGVATVLEGLRQCAIGGTASALAGRAAAKTGTAPCVHSPSAPGDGLLIAMFPVETPEFVLLVRGHGMTGAGCARRSAAFVRAVTA